MVEARTEGVPVNFIRTSECISSPAEWANCLRLTAGRTGPAPLIVLPAIFFCNSPVPVLHRYSGDTLHVAGKIKKSTLGVQAASARGSLGLQLDAAGLLGYETNQL